MLADIPFTSISEEHLNALVARRIREDRRIDFKQVLVLGQGDANFQVVRDIVAFANADGGAIVYGIVEGDGDDAGVAVGIEAMIGDADTVSNTIDNLLRTSIDERIPGVLHGPIHLTNGGYAYVIRVPASPLAPHMVTQSVKSPRFFTRSNTTNEPMTARQIKDSARQHDYAVERASATIQNRISALRERAAHRKHFNEKPAPPNQGVLHMIPLFPHRLG